jgi:hypothetical protein
MPAGSFRANKNLKEKSMDQRIGVMMFVLACVILLAGVPGLQGAYAAAGDATTEEVAGTTAEGTAITSPEAKPVKFPEVAYREGDELTFLRFGPRQQFTNAVMTGLDLDFLFHEDTTFLEVAQKWYNNVHNPGFWVSAETEFQYADEAVIKKAVTDLVDLLESSGPTISWSYRDLFTLERVNLPDATAEVKAKIWEVFTILEAAGMDLPFLTNDKTSADEIIDALLDPGQGNFGAKNVDAMVSYLKGSWTLNQVQIAALRKGISGKIIFARLPDSLVLLTRQVVGGAATTRVVVMSTLTGCGGPACCCRLKSGACYSPADETDFCVSIYGAHCNNGISDIC